VTPADLLEVLCAAHLSSYVPAPSEDRGGIMLVGPPNTFKSTMLDTVDRQYPDTLQVSDLNAKALSNYRDAMSGGSVRSLLIPELAKLYQRKAETAENLEGTIQALVAEGWHSASFEDSRQNRFRARCFCIAAMTPKTQQVHYQQWEDSGFSRRFLWSLYRLKNPDALERALLEWRRVEFEVVHLPRQPHPGEIIRNTTTYEERQLLQRWVKYQPGVGAHTLQVQTLTRMLAVLKWWYAQVSPQRSAIDTLSRFAASLGREGAEVELAGGGGFSVQKRTAERRKAEKVAVSAAAKLMAKRRKRK